MRKPIKPPILRKMRLENTCQIRLKSSSNPTIEKRLISPYNPVKSTFLMFPDTTGAEGLEPSTSGFGERRTPVQKVTEIKQICTCRGLGQRRAAAETLWKDGSTHADKMQTKKKIVSRRAK